MASPYAQYPRGQNNYTGDVSFDSLSEAWKIVTSNLGVFIPSALIFIVITYAVNFVTQLPFQAGMLAAQASVREHPEAIGALYAAMIPGLLLSSFIGSVVQMTLMSGMMKMGLNAARGTAPQIGDLFAGLSKIGNVLIASLVIAVAATIGMCLCLIPGFIVYGLTMFTMLYILDQDMSGMDALKKSVQVLTPFLFMATVLYFVAALVAGLGILACCVGVIVTFSILPVTVAVAYRNMNDLPPTQAAPVPAGPVAPMSPGEAEEMPRPPE